MTIEDKAKNTLKQPIRTPVMERKEIPRMPIHPQKIPSAIKQTLVFTIMVRGVSMKTGTLPVSVYASPRLFGAQKLGAFQDWIRWTRLLKEKGFSFEVQCGAQKTTVQINREVLQPDLWEELFKDDTLVRPYDFPDYSNRGILSFSIRQTLSALKATYQKAGLEIGLPDNPTEDPTGKRKSNRRKLTEMVDGFDVHWDGRLAGEWRNMVRTRKPSMETLNYQGSPPLSGALDSEGAIIAQPDSEALKKIALPFAVFHHMPTPKYDHNRDSKGNLILNTKDLLDFHQVLSSLNSYPDLLRALGLVFDLELPANFVQATAVGKYGTFWVSKVTPGWSWSLAPEMPHLKTAYVLIQAGGKNLFCNAPRYLDDPTFPTAVIGLLQLNPKNFGLAQLDVDGGMHKTINMAETLHPSIDANKGNNVQPLEAPNPEVFDPEATLPSLRSGGFSLYADKRAQQLLSIISQSKTFNDAVEGGTPQKRPFFEEDLVRGYRLDVWDSFSNNWHSLHMRQAEYLVGEKQKLFQPKNKTEEGFIQMAITQPADGAQPITNDLYLHEAMARWDGWSLSAPMPSKHLSRYADPSKAVPKDNDPEYSENQPDTPFKLTTKFTVTPKSLPRLKFGTTYRFRARAVDLAGNSLQVDDDFAKDLSSVFGLPLDPEGFPYLRFEPVGAPLIILRNSLAIEDPTGVYDRGSAIDRLVIRTFNDDINKDENVADTTAADRHIVPPRTSVEMAERLGMFDDSSGKIKGDAATWQLISKREAGEFNKIQLKIKGHVPKEGDEYPVEPVDKIDSMPYLPDLLSRGAAIRDLPGTPCYTVGNAEPGAGAPSRIAYDPLTDPNPRPGSATMISFGGGSDWQKTVGFRFELNEPQLNQEDLRPQWDPNNRVLSVYLPKGQTKVVPLSSYTTTEDLKLLGVWKWLREYIERITVTDSERQLLVPGTSIDRIAHILQRTVEGGHWMLTPPRLLTLVHAVQQPLGRPEFTALNIEHTRDRGETLESSPVRGKADPAALAPVTAWRRLGETSAYIMGSLLVHGASTAKVDLKATWDDPVDDVSKKTWAITSHAATVDELPLKTLKEQYLRAAGAEYRNVGYYDPEHDQIAFVRLGDWTGYKSPNPLHFIDAAPRHLLNDTKHHVVKYTAIATSRYREYFKQDQNLDFTRSSEPVNVDVPASARPFAPDVAFVIPTFGWERQTDTNLKRSVRFGGGLRVYLHRPWFSSGADELLGVTLWSASNGTLDQAMRDKFKPYFTQWGMDPIWQTDSLTGAPTNASFPDRVAQDIDATLEEPSAMLQNNHPGLVNVVGFKPEFDESRGLWYADLTINTPREVYAPFIRLALVRYQPHALANALISRVILADFAQLTPDRSAMVTADPYHPRTLRVAVSGVAPRGPEMTAPAPNKRPTQINIRVQRRIPKVKSDLAWTDAPVSIASVKPDTTTHPELVLWAGTVQFINPPNPNEFRLVITEVEFISGSTTGAIEPKFEPPNRIIYSEIFDIDSALIGQSK
jgi:hypothetical protein